MSPSCRGLTPKIGDVTKAHETVSPIVLVRKIQRVGRQYAGTQTWTGLSHDSRQPAMTTRKIVVSIDGKSKGAVMRRIEHLVIGHFAPSSEAEGHDDRFSRR